MVDLIDMQLFIRALANGSLSAAGRELGFSPAVASKRLTRIENQLGVRLMQRNSRHLTLTEEGALYADRCRQILADIEEAENIISTGKQEALGTLHVSCPVALGRHSVGAAINLFSTQWPKLRVRLSLSDSIVDLFDGGFDCAIRIGGSEDSRLVARTLADNHRIICASPDYLSGQPLPTVPEDLSRLQAIAMSAQFTDRVNWRLVNAITQTNTTVSVPVRMATNNGEQAQDWALAGLGIIYRSFWDVKKELETGELIRLLPEWQSDPAPIRIVFPSRQFLPARTRLFIDHMVNFFQRA